MKRFVQSSKLFAVAALVVGSLAPAMGAPLSGGDKQASPHVFKMQSTAERPGAAAASGMAAKLDSRMSPAALARRRALAERRQKVLSMRQAQGPAMAVARRMDAPASAVKFPGFLQADVLTPGTAPGDQNNAVAVLTGDINKDGKPDIVNVQLDGAISVLLNPGADKIGTMAVSSVNTSIAANRQVHYAVLADLEGSGYPDVLAVDYASNSVFIFPNRKDGTFGPATAQALTFSSGVSMLSGGGIAVGDFNGDGKLDVAAYMMNYGYSSSNLPQTSFELVVYPGNGDGTFAAPLPEQFTLLNSLGTTMPGQVQVADVNNDGNLDIVYMAGGFDVANYEEVYVSALLGDGKGGFTHPPIDLPKSGAIAPGIADGAIVGGIKLADVDGDGNLDVIFANCEDDNLYYAKGNGDGTFANAQQPITDLGYPNSLAFADVNGDGKIDVIAYGDDYTAIFAGLGNGAFAQPYTQFSSSLSQYVPGDPADFNGDGQLDIVRTDGATGYTSVYLQQNGVFDASPVLGVPNESASYFQAVASGDFNGDGFPDVLAIDYTAYWTQQNHYPYPDIVMGLNDGKGNFNYQVVLDHDTLNTLNAGDADSGLIEPMVGDFNGDGYSDFILSGENGLYMVLSKGPGAFAAPAPLALGVATSCAVSRMDIGDLNGDGKQDIVFAYPGDASCYSPGSTPSGVISLLGNGDGTFTSQFTAIGASAYMPKLIDFNGDGKLDLALSDVNSDEFAFDFFVLPGNGDGTFNAAAATHPLQSGTEVTTIIAGDFNGDGKQDLTVGTMFREDPPFNFLPGTTGIETLAGNGDFTFGPSQMYAFGGYPYDGKYADFNGDGKPDLAINVGWDMFQASPYLSNFGYLVNQGDGTFGAFQPSVSTTFDEGGFFYAGDYNAYGNVMVADFNGDGAPDVLSVLDYDEALHYASQLFLNAGAVKLSLTTDAATINEGSPLAVTASVNASVGSKTPTGSVSFFDNGAPVANSPITGGAVVYSDPNPAVGNHVITAQYSGDDNFNAATASAAVNVTVDAVAPSFVLAPAQPSIVSVLQGSQGTFQLSVTSNATFSGSVALSCSGAPNLSTCTINPGSVTLTGNQTATATVTVTTTATTTAENRTPRVPGALRGAATLAALLMLVWPGRLRRARRLWLAVVFGVLTASAIGSMGCGGGGMPKTAPGTPQGQSTLTITATSGSITQTQSVTLNVQ